MNMFTVQILQMLLGSGQAGLLEILSRLNITKRMFLYYLRQLNDFLKAAGLLEAQFTEDVLYLDVSDRDRYKQLLESLDPKDYYLESRERQECMLLLIGIAGSPLTLEDFVNTFHVSRRTLLNDLNALKDFLRQQEIHLLNSLKDGYYLQGEELVIRYQLFLAYHNRDNLCISRIKR